jgi:hypothetical protein
MGKKVCKERVDRFFTYYQLNPLLGPDTLQGWSAEVIFSKATFTQCIQRWVHDASLISIIYPAFSGFDLIQQASDPGDKLDLVRCLHAKGQCQSNVMEQIQIVETENQVTFTFSPYQETEDGSTCRYADMPLGAWVPNPNYFQVSEYTLSYTALESPKPSSLEVPFIGQIQLAWKAIPLSPMALAQGNQPTSLKVWEALLARCFKWCTHDYLGGYTPVDKDVLIEKSIFAKELVRLKKQYAAALCSSWTECTDPKKFVYEDLALTAYLICLWESPLRRPSLSEAELRALTQQSVYFADLGCGNGLLTYLLHCEGFHGYGIDSRARKIWTRWQQAGAQLHEAELNVHEYAFPPQVNWLLGNHADELVPWIPTLAQRISPLPNLFLLPCCFYNTSGKLFCPPKSAFPVPSHLEKAGSRYKRYLQYVGEACDRNQYNVVYDSLRIPSTKNIALICTPKADALLPS